MSKHWVVRYEYKDRAPYEAKWFNAFLGEPDAAAFRQLVNEDKERGHDPIKITLSDDTGIVLEVWIEPEPKATQPHLFIVQESLL